MNIKRGDLVKVKFSGIIAEVVKTLFPRMKEVHRKHYMSLTGQDPKGFHMVKLNIKKYGIRKYYSPVDLKLIRRKT